jgi:succinate dehydrogenase / fumarate reductase membrane anchor subunit
MLTNVTSLTGNGLKDWLIQRFSAIYLVIYTLFIFSFLFSHPHLSFEIWKNLFSCVLFKLATVLTLFMLLLHSWVGLWTVCTDYLKCTALRLSVLFIILFFLLSQFIWGLMIILGQ